MNDGKIAVIDSELGGLTVVKLLKERMSNENIIYFGDNARVPYGDKSEENIKIFSEQIIRFLMKKDIKYLAIACNTMSSVALDTIKGLIKVPIADVINPTIAYIKKEGLTKLGIIATKATIQSNIYEEKIKNENKEIQIYSRACPIFVPIIELGLIDGVMVDDAIENNMSEYKKINPEAIISGCTHYTVWEDKIRRYFEDKIKIINTSAPIVDYVEQDIKGKGMINKNDKKGGIELYFSDSCDRYKEYFENLFQDENIKVNENIKL